MKNTHIILIIFLFCFLFKKSKSKENFTDETSTECTFEKAYWDSTSNTIGRPCEPKPNGTSDCGEEFYCDNIYKQCQGKIFINFGDKVSCDPKEENRCATGFKCSSISDDNPNLGVCVNEEPSSNFSGYACGKDDDCQGFENLKCNSNNVCEEKTTEDSFDDSY